MTTQSSQASRYIFPIGTSPLESQVAGHTFESSTNSVGILKNACDATVLKPLGKPECGAREIIFYESIKNADVSDLLAVRKLVPKYFGTVRMILNDKEVDFIKLADLTFGIYEPCIMDIKVGKRTWDPLATPEKRAAEEEKYAACKQSLGLCIPGFQVYNLLTNKLQRFGKDYGKALNDQTFKSTIKMYLNGEVGICHSLISQILCQLRAIQKWSQTQTSIKLFSSSILLVYDARRLKVQLQEKTNILNNSNGSISFKIDNTPSDVNKKVDNNWASDLIPSYNDLPIDDAALKNTNAESKAVRDNCVFKGIASLMEFSNSDVRDWVRVKMIDFAHAFPSDDNSNDTNYLFGIDNLVKIFESFLKESY